MHSGPYAEKERDNTGAQDIRCAAGVGVRFPMDDIGTVAEEKRTHHEE